MKKINTFISDYKQKANLDNLLIKEFQEEKKDTSFDELTCQLSLPIETLSKYTSLLKDASTEYSHCKKCKNLLECKNKITGYAYLPKIQDKTLEFGYVPCKYQKKQAEQNKYLDNISLFEMPTSIRFASFSDVYMEDKNRFKTIKWLKEFIDNYEKNANQKGLYLHGNFGCGKTYLIAALTNTMAKKNVKSAIVFWPDFLRMLKNSFQSDYQEKIEKIKKVPILCIDDIGAEATTTWGRDEILCPILQYRMQEQLPTFFTSNLDLNALEQHFSISKDGVEIIKARRIIERIKQLTDDIEMISENLRK